MSMLIEVTSPAIRPLEVDEPVSPELALVDPVLAERLRALLPDPAPEAEPERLATVHVLHAGATPIPVVAAASTASVPAALPVPVERSVVRRTLVSFAAGALLSAVVVFGIMAELSERDLTPSAPPTASGTTPSLAPPLTPQAQTPTQTPTPKAAPKKAAPKAAAKKAASKPVAPKAKTTPAKKQAPAASKAKTPAAPKVAATQVAPARRFAWAPVPDAVGYRFELFRGERQVLRRTTETPAFELGATWQHQGRSERLGSGAYRWYVWPILPDGKAAAEAIVQAQLTVP